MADFCLSCNVELFNVSVSDFAPAKGVATPDNVECWVICEGCGPIVVTAKGNKVRELSEAEWDEAIREIAVAEAVIEAQCVVEDVANTG